MYQSDCARLAEIQITEENIANTSSIDLTGRGNGHHMRDFEELLLQIVQDIGGGGELPLKLLDLIVFERTDRTISTWMDCAEGDVLECIQGNLSPQSSLIVSLENRSLSVKCVEQILNCCAESDLSLEMVNKGTTTLDLSRRRVSSNELLEICRPARMLRHLILNDIQIQPGSKEPLASPLIERIKWYCPALKIVETTGCSQAVYKELFQNGKNAYPGASGVQVVDLLETKPEVKELLDPLLAKREVAYIANRIKALVQRGVPANVTFDGWSLLHTAVVIGDEDLVIWLLEKSGSFKFRLKNSTRPTALEVAIRCHNEAIVAQLLHTTDFVDPAWLASICFSKQFLMANERGVRERHHGCNLLQVTRLCLEKNETLEFKTTFLIQTIIEFQRLTPRELKEKTCWTEEYLEEMLKHLVSAGCSLDVHIKDLGGKTPLMCTVSSPVLLKTLVDFGADIHATDEMGNTALFYAVADATVETTNKHIETTKFLLENRAEPNVFNKDGQTPILFDASKERSNWQLEEIFSGYKLLIWNVLIQWGAKLTTTKTEDRKSLLHLAIEHSKEYIERCPGSDLVGRAAKWCVQIIKFVSEHDKRLLMSRDMSGNTALHLWAGHYSRHAAEMEAIGKALIEGGSHVKITNDQGKTPLHLAKLWSVAEFLLSQRSKPNAIDDEERTPLLCKCIEANKEQSPKLEQVSTWAEGINLGMDPWSADKDGRNVFKVFITNGDFRDLERFIEVAIKKDRESILKTDNRGNTLLHLLCNCSDSRVLPLIDLVLKYGVKVDAQNEEGDTGLHIACRKEIHLPPRKGRKRRIGNNSVYKRVILKVLAYGARINIKNKKNASASNLVWLNKRLLAMLKNDRQRKTPLPIYPWVSQSSNHKERLSMVARGLDTRKIDNYCYSGPIGSGTSSMVFAAINVRDGREVALKRVERRSPRTRQADREINSLLQLSNSNQIVQYFNVISGTDFTWIVLELMEGTLNDLPLFNSPLTELSKDVLLGIEYLHSNSILHRDLKPGNVLYTTKPKLRLKISDFGLSKRVDGGEGSSVLHSNAGTRVWMAPELLSSSGHPQHSFASDIFSLGLVLHFILANKRHPFARGAGRLSNSLAECNIVETNITTGSLTLSSDLSDEGKDLLKMVLTANRDERPNASEALKHPLFWTDDTKIAFITAVANQSEIGEYGRAAPSLVETEIEHKVGTMLSSKWDLLFPTLYAEMTSSGRGRKYDTKSGVHLIRFMRNAYAHVSDRTRSTRFQKKLLTDRIFFTTLPKLFMIVFKAAKQGNWHVSRAEISKFFNG